MWAVDPGRQATTQDIAGHFVTAPKNVLPQDIRLDSWKAIAAFFGKDERTVKRWEKERGLPVRRVPGAVRGTVFAYTSELEGWLSGSGNTPESLTQVASADDDSAAPPVDRAVPVVVPKPVPPVTAKSSRWIFLVVPILVVGTFLVYSSTGHHEIHFRKALAAPHQPDATAQDLYLKGRFYFEKRTPSDLNTAVDAFTQAIVHDPAYPQAYVGLADSYSLLREYSTMPAFEAEQRARAAAQKAVELDPNLAEAHTSLAFAEFWGFLDAADADREFRRAIELDPNLARAHHWYATFLIQVLRPQEALAEIERARQLDPSSKAIVADKGSILSAAGRTEEAASILKQMEVSDPNFRSAHAYLGFLYWNQGDYENALAEFREQAVSRGDEKGVKNVEQQQAALHAGGVQGLFQYQLRTALAFYGDQNGPSYNVASAYGYLHDRDNVMKFLQLARKQHDYGLADLEVAPQFRWLHSDPEYRKFVTDLGLPALP